MNINTGKYSSMMLMLYRECKHHARTKHNRAWTLTKDEFQALVYQPCYYCGCKPRIRTRKISRVTTVTEAINGIDRIDSSLAYTINNCVPSCWACNDMKNDLKIEDFLQHISDIYKHTLERSSTSAKARTPKRVEMGNTREGEDIVRSVRRRTAAKAVKD